ncbi:MAG: hypothetical protein ACTSO9_07475 [Candidatus Helarchaeota archaeon]
MAVFEAANSIRKWLNFLAPPISFGLALLWNLVIWPNMVPPGFAGLFYPLMKLFGMGGQIGTWEIINIIVSGIGFGIYYIPNFGPFKGINDEDIYIWPELVMTLVCSALISWGSSWWGGTLMWILWVFVWFLADPPIWEAESSRSV